jgi:putative DNA primase/helicase
LDFSLETVNGPMTVGQLGKKQDGLTMCDPFEPDYDGGSKTKARFFWNDGNPIINSQAHGGIVYRIVKKTVAVADVKNRYMLSSRLPADLFVDINESENGAITVIPTLSNLKIMLNGYGVSVIYDEAIKAQQILIPGDKSMRHDLHNEACYTQILALAELNRINRRIADLLPVLLIENTVNPVKDWIFSREWDGVPRIGDLCANLVVSDSKRDMYNKIIRTWLIQCCAALDRAEIGCRLNSKARAKYELILVLQGAEGITKTDFFTKLLPTELNGEKFSTRYIKDGSNLSLDSRDSIKQNVSCWINELGELDATFKKSDISALKAFCSNGTDIMRLAYAHTDCNLTRATSFCGTVNDELFLVDSTGSRRFGVIAVEAILDRDIDMQQLWAEVWGLYASGEQWWLDKGTETVMQVSNADHQSINPIEDGILSKFDWDSEESQWAERMTMTEIYQACFDKKPNRTDLNAIKPFLIKCGVRIVRIHGAMTAYMPAVRRMTSSADDMPPMFS